MLLIYSRNPRVGALLSGLPWVVSSAPQYGPRGELRWVVGAEWLRGVTEIVPSFSDPGSPGVITRYHLTLIDQAGEMSEIDFDATGGEWAVAPRRVLGRGVQFDVDLVKLHVPLREIRLELECAGGRTPSAEAICAVSFRRESRGSGEFGALGHGDLAVPPFSQFSQSDTIGHRICSPTSVAMVLNYHGVPATPTEVAARAYSAAHDLYGVWPANIDSAASFGVGGFLCHLTDWESVDYFLRRSIPLVASIRYTPDDLHGAPFYRPSGETTAHLVVVRGCRDGRVVVNDPAGRSPAEVYREYSSDQFAKVWFERSAMAYVLLPP